MSKIFGLLTILTLTVGCFTIGKVGYMVPAPTDTNELSEDKVGEKCAFIVTNIINELNQELEYSKKSDLSNVGLQFTNSNCAQARNYKEGTPQ
ncbi:putative lipoprotein [Leptospira weilii serovar Topaz str. LT2116]|uniref:Putative lipoprotein n=1 Tax=Leptospira weilii serovar Topaz str. LT2116 TaxID=1088540 RepID=M3G7D8_9LEPT|nr:putative lipoprotein [Leptospira weilii serovar Topaz str. LT2116]